MVGVRSRRRGVRGRFGEAPRDAPNEAAIVVVEPRVAPAVANGDEPSRCQRAGVARSPNRFDSLTLSVIARVKALRAEGHAMTRIAKALDALGVQTRSGRPWHPQQVARILR
jgi:hypothetical protein